MATYNKSTGTSGTLRINVTWSQNTSSDTTSYSFSYQIINTSGATFVGSLGWNGNAAGVSHSGSVGISGSGTYTLWSTNRGPLSHDSNGNLSAANRRFWFTMHASGTSGLGGPTTIDVTVPVPRIPEAPGAPGDPSVSNIQDDRATFTWTAASRGHADITDYGVYVSTSSSFSSHVHAAWEGVTLSKTVTGLAPGVLYYMRTRARNGDGIGPYSDYVSFRTRPAAPATPNISNLTPTSMRVTWLDVLGATDFDLQIDETNTFSSPDTYSNVPNILDIMGLTPGTTYYIRVRGKNSAGAGDWSPTRTTKTLTSTAPGIVVSPRPTGSSALITLSPPGGYTGVTRYNIERRRTGTTSPVTNGTTTSTSLTMTGLTPGQSYQYRANAEFGSSYTSPWSSWVTAVQPNPNTSPGEFYDGNTPDDNGLVFAWTGTTNNSTSTVTAASVLGVAASHAASAGASVVQRILGGVAGEYAARLLITLDAGSEGLTFGNVGASPYWSDVEEGFDYTGSIYVRPSRAQRLSARLVWYNAAGAVISTSTALSALVEPGEFTRLHVTDEAPAGADWAVVVVVDVSGTGWSVWRGGEYLDIDAAMVTLGEGLTIYFDGDSPNDWIDGVRTAFSWMSTPNASASIGVPIQPSLADPLIDPDCPPLPTPPTPPTIDSMCVDDTGVWRRYWVSIPAESISRGLVTMPRLSIFTGADSAGQVRVRYYPNPDDLDPTTLTVAWEAEQIVSFVPANTEFLLDSLFGRAQAKQGNGRWLDAGHLVYSTGGLPPTWPLLECGTSFAMSIDVPSDSASGNESFNLDLVVRH